MNTSPLYPRWAKSRIEEALLDTPVVLIVGPRQAGKTTLVRQFIERGMHYLTLDDELTLLSAREDPVGMIRNLNYAVIDEIQRAPQLLLAIKKSVDEDRRPGRFLLTGSANLMTLPTVADSLAGRMETLLLLPLSQNEIQKSPENWIDSIFAGEILTVNSPVLGNALVDRVLCGGYPEAIARPTSRRRTTWARQYIDAVIQRDVRDIAEVGKLNQLPLLLRALAHTAGQICNHSETGGKVGLDGKTVSRYIDVFEQMYLLKRIDTWARNRLKRIVKSPKIQFIDSGLLVMLMDVTVNNLQVNRSRYGQVLESFVFGELLKHTTTAEHDYRILYYRDADKFEVDIVIENSAGQLVGVEIKASATVKDRDLRGLRKLANLAGDEFTAGVLLYDGDETLPLGSNIWAAPLSTLWGHSNIRVS